MEEPTARSSIALRPATVFRSALAELAARERSGRARRPDRVQAVAGLTDGDLAALSAAFEELLHSTSNVSAIAASLHATLRALGPDVPAGEVDDA